MYGFAMFVNVVCEGWRRKVSVATVAVEAHWAGSPGGPLGWEPWRPTGLGALEAHWAGSAGGPLGWEHCSHSRRK